MKTKISFFAVLLLVSVMSLAACQVSADAGTKTPAEVITDNYDCPIDYSRLEESFYLTDDVPDETIQELGDAYCHMNLTSILAKEGLADVHELVAAQESYLKSYGKVTGYTSQYIGYEITDPETLTLWLSGLVLAQEVPEKITLINTDKYCDSGVENPCNLYRQYTYMVDDNSYIYTATLEDERGVIIGVWVDQGFGIYSINRDCKASIVRGDQIKDIYQCPITWSALYLEGGHEVILTENGLVIYDNAQ